MLCVKQESFDSRRNLRCVSKSTSNSKARAKANGFARLEDNKRVIKFRMSLRVPSLGDIAPIQCVVRPRCIDRRRLGRRGAVRRIRSTGSARD